MSKTKKRIIKKLSEKPFTKGYFKEEDRELLKSKKTGKKLSHEEPLQEYFCFNSKGESDTMIKAAKAAEEARAAWDKECEGERGEKIKEYRSKLDSVSRRQEMVKRNESLQNNKTQNNSKPESKLYNNIINDIELLIQKTIKDTVAYMTPPPQVKAVELTEKESLNNKIIYEISEILKKEKVSSSIKIDSIRKIIYNAPIKEIELQKTISNPNWRSESIKIDMDSIINPSDEELLLDAALNKGLSKVCHKLYPNENSVVDDFGHINIQSIDESLKSKLVPKKTRKVRKKSKKNDSR